MKLLGIEVGEHFTRVGCISVVNGKYSLGENFAIKTPQGTYDDGFIEKYDELIDLLFASFHKYGITCRKAAFVISSSKIINREIVLPFVKGAKVEPLVMSNISEYFPVDLSLYRVSWKIMEKFTDDTEQKKMRLMVIAVPRELLENYGELAKQLGVNLVSIDYAGNSIYQLVKKSVKDETLFSLHIGDNTSIASIVRNGVLELQRTIPFGVDYILDTVMEYFPDVRGKKLVVLEKLKANQWVNGMMEIDDDDDETGISDDEKKKKRITESLKPFIDRVERLTHYYISMKNDARLDKMVLTGTGSSINGLPQLLQFELGMIVGGINSMKNLKVEGQKAKKATEEHLGPGEELTAELSGELTSMALCMGSLMDTMDLMPDSAKGKKNVNVSITPGIIAAVASAVLCGGMIGYTKIQLKNAEEENERLCARINELSAVEAVYTKYGDVNDVLNDVMDMVNSSRTPNEYLVEFIEELETKLPNSAKITSMSVTSSGVSLGIETGSWIDSADTIAQLKTFNTIENFGVNSISEIEVESTETKEVYYVNGEKVDSIADYIDDENAVISIGQIDEGDVEIRYSFSVTLEWKSVEQLEEEATSNEDNTDIIKEDAE